MALRRPTLKSDRVERRQVDPERVGLGSLDFASRLTPYQAGMLDDVLACAAIGSPGTVRARLTSLIARTGADELILTSQIYDHAARVRSFEIAAVLHED